MTLIELMVVLAILALLTTVAVTSSDIFVSQGRYDATTSTLTNIQEAVLGPPNARQADGTLVSMGFVADVGRLPRGVSVVMAAGQSVVGIPELWAWNSATSWTLRSPNDTDVLINLGRRGPYLRLPPGLSAPAAANNGQIALCDGWGNPLVLTNAAGGSANVGDAIVSASSIGAGSSSSSPYNVPPAVSVLPPQIALSGYVYVLDSNGNQANPITAVQVWMYYPNITTGQLAELQCTTTGSPGSTMNYAMPAGAAVNTGGFVRAYLGDRTSGTRHCAGAVPSQRRN